MIPNDLLLNLGTLIIITIGGIYLLLNNRKMKKFKERLVVLAALKTK